MTIYEPVAASSLGDNAALFITGGPLLFYFLGKSHRFDYPVRSRERGSRHRSREQHDTSCGPFWVTRLQKEYQHLEGSQALDLQYYIALKPSRLNPADGTAGERK